jgi:hypothetical protein
MAESFRKQVIITAVTATLSMAAGFIVVYLIVGPSGSETPVATQAPAEGGTKEAGGPSVGPAEAAQESTSMEGTPLSLEDVGKPSQPDAAPVPAAQEKSGPDAPGTAPPPEPPPQPAAAEGPAAVKLVDFSVMKCWKTGDETPVEKEACGKPAGLDAVVKSNLAAIGACVKDFAGASPGKISLAMKIEFAKERYRAWLGSATTISGVEETSACLRQLYTNIPFQAMDHTFDTYLVFYSLEYQP